MLFAFLVLRKFNHSLLGFSFSAVIISTWSPVLRTYESGTRRRLTFAAIALLPISVWMAYARSRAVAPFSMLLCSPLGVKTRMSVLIRSLWIISRRSRALTSGLTRISLTLVIHLSISLSFDSANPSFLYAQWAAIPFSAISFILLERICTSTHMPDWLISVQWRAS